MTLRPTPELQREVCDLYDRTQVAGCPTADGSTS
jgi:hypothetical protein